MGDAPRLAVEGLSLSVEGRTILHEVSFTLSAHDIAVIEGPSGGGKSTFLRVLATLTQPDRGRLRLDGMDSGQIAFEAWRRQVAYVSQAPVMLPGSVASNLAAGPALAGKSLSAEEVHALANEVGLPEAIVERSAQSLSGGERMRVAVARALANAPRVLLLDEPTAALDTVSAKVMVDLVSRLASKGTSIALVTHAEEHAAAVRGTRYVLAGGALRERGA